MMLLRFTFRAQVRSIVVDRPGWKRRLVVSQLVGTPPSLARLMPYLKLMCGRDLLGTFPLHRREITIGRDPDAESCPEEGECIRRDSTQENEDAEHQTP